MAKGKGVLALVLIAAMLAGVLTAGGCSDSSKTADGKTLVDIVSYKQEAVQVMEAIQDKFNAEHDDIELRIESPNEAVTIIRTRLIREDYPDAIFIGGDATFSNFLDAGLFMNIEDCQPAVSEVQPVYLQMLKNLERIPVEGVYGLPYAANAAGMLYNKEMFEEHGWKVPYTWTEFVDLCEQIKAAGIYPLYAGYKDSWTTLAPWNAIASSIAESNLAAQVNAGVTTFKDAYRKVAEEMQVLEQYMEPNPVAYGYNDACTAFANGESAMICLGSYAIPQITSVNPTMDIGSFTFPALDTKEDNKLTSGVDMCLCVFEAKRDNQAAIYEVVNWLYQDDVLNMYLDDQGGLSCKEGDFPIPYTLTDMTESIENGRLTDYQDHSYPSELGADGLIQTFLLDKSPEAIDTFLDRFDEQWQRYNRDIIARVQAYYESIGEDPAQAVKEQSGGEDS